MEDTISERSFEIKSLENIQKQYIQTNSILLGIHVLLSIPYYFLSPKHMLMANLFSIMFYVLGFAFLKKSRKILTMYSFMILMEILAHDICCVLIFGWKCGFQLWIISLVSTYIKDYISPDKPDKEKLLYSIIITMIGFFTFLSLYLITNYVPIPFQDPPSKGVTTGFVIMNSLLTFTGMSAFTGIYTQQMEYKYTELHYHADYDQLTGLGNRYYMNDLLHMEERKSSAFAGYSVAMIDIDHFKLVNDTYGHNNGDVVLKDIAQILSKNIPENYRVARWGGEEFLILSSHTVDYESFQRVLETIRKKIASHIYVLENKQRIHCTVSIGAFQYREGYSVQDVITRADKNLYVAKDAGRNRIVA